MSYVRLSRIISGPQVEHVAPVRFDSLMGEPEPVEPVEPVVAADDEFEQAQDDEAYRAAYEDGYDEGYRVGQQQAEREGQQRLQDYIKKQGRQEAERMESLLINAEHGLVVIQQQLAQNVLELACELARHVIRQEVSVNPITTLAVVREALANLGTEGRAVTVRLHPDDHEIMHMHLRGNRSLSYVTWQQDSTLRPGDCLVESGGTTIDGTLESRWRRAIGRLGMDAPLFTPEDEEPGGPVA